MHAVVGDRLHVRGNAVATPTGPARSSRSATRVAQPPYLVRFDDGHTCLMFPGPDAVVEHPAKTPGPEGTRQGGPRRRQPRKGAPRPGQRLRRGGTWPGYSCVLHENRDHPGAHRAAPTPCMTSRRNARSSRGRRLAAATACCTCSSRTPRPGVAVMELGAGSDRDLLAVARPTCCPPTTAGSTRTGPAGTAGRTCCPRSWRRLRSCRWWRAAGAGHLAVGSNCRP